MKSEKNTEKLRLMAGIALIVLIAYMTFFLFPTLDGMEQARKKIESDSKNMVKLEQLLEENAVAPEEETKQFEGSLITFVEQKAKDLNIDISYIRPYGKTGEGVEVKIDEMPGSEILKFAYEMEQNGVRITRLNTRDYKGQGLWVVKFNLEKG